VTRAALVLMAKADSQAPTSLCRRTWPRTASSAPVAHPAHQVPQDHPETVDRKAATALLAALANLAALDPQARLVVKETMAELEHLDRKDHPAKMAPPVPKDPTATLDHPDHLAQLLAKATMANPAKQAALDHLDRPDLPVTRPTMALLASLDPQDLLAHLAKMLSIVLALRVPNERKRSVTLSS